MCEKAGPEMKRAVSPGESRWPATGGYSQYELIAAIFLIFLLLFGVLIMVMPGDGYDTDTGELDVPPYRWANAMYAYNALQRVQAGAMAYFDLHQHIPGDSPKKFENATHSIRGDGDGRIERSGKENVKFFIDLHRAGIMPSETILIRGRELDVFWLELKADDRVLSQGNFFKLPGMNLAEARALDYKYDDGWNDGGDIFYSIRDDDTADLYVNFKLF